MTPGANREPLPQLARALFDGPNFVTMGTVDPDGCPQLSVVWAKLDGGDILISTIKGRRKYSNLLREPRASVLVYAAGDPYRYVEIRGTVTIIDDPEAELINDLAVKYTGEEFGDRPGEQRVIVRIVPEHVVLYLD
jgi:PPOX class probable F420-dependent enzyme